MQFWDREGKGRSRSGRLLCYQVRFILFLRFYRRCTYRLIWSEYMCERLPSRSLLKDSERETQKRTRVLLSWLIYSPIPYLFFSSLCLFSFCLFILSSVSLSSLLSSPPHTHTHTPLWSPLFRARLWFVDRISGKLFGNPNLSEIIWLQPLITCWFGYIKNLLRSNDFHLVFQLYLLRFLSKDST